MVITLPIAVTVLAVAFLFFLLFCTPAGKDPVAVGTIVVAGILLVAIGLNWDMVAHATVQALGISTPAPVVGNR